MGWSIGYDSKWKRDIGYGVPAWCDHPGCIEEIYRGLSHVCGGEPYGGERGCGLYSGESRSSAQLPGVNRKGVDMTEREEWLSLIYMANRARRHGKVVLIAEVIAPTTAAGDFSVFFQAEAVDVASVAI